MATERIERSVEDLEREVTCAICQCHYTEPKVLPCCHYYCKECVRSLVVRVGVGKPFSCPECRTATTLPEGGVDDLPTAFFVNRIKEALSRLSRVYGKDVAVCEMCSGPTADAFCRHCAMFICSECIRQHERMKVFTSHVVTALNDLKSGRSEDIVVPKPPLKVCEAHDQPMNIYCFDCSCLICRDCTIKVHNGHNHEFLKVAAPEMRKNLVAKLQPMRKVQADLSRAVEDISSVTSSLEVESYCISDMIERSWSELIKDIYARKEELLKATKLTISRKMEYLSGRERLLSTASAVIHSVVEYTEQCVEHLADDEIMCTHSEIQERIEREINKHVMRMKQPKPKSTRPAFVRTVGLGLARPFGVAAMLNGEIIAAEKGDLNIMGSNGRRLSKITVDLLRCVAVDSATGNVFAAATKKIFKLRPNMKLVKVYGIDSVCIMGIAVVKDRVFVCDGRCLIFTKDFQFKMSFGEEHMNGHFHSICSDRDSNLYLSNCGNLSVSSYTYEGTLLRVFDQPAIHCLPSGGFSPTGICVSGDHVYVANQKTHSIAIFTTGGKYVGSFGSKGCSHGRFDHPRGICVDKDGSLYICDRERVQMFATEHS